MPLRVKKATCTGCKLCQLACSGWHERCFNPEKARINVEHDYNEKGIHIGIHFCNQCNKCIDTCPENAISSNGKWILVDRNLCIGCKTCSKTCPLDAVRYDSEGKSVICDLCEGEPQCIDWCPKEVIYFREKKTQAGRETT